MSGVKFEITADNSDLIRKMQETRAAIMNSGKTAQSTVSAIDGEIRKTVAGIGELARSMAGLGGALTFAGMTQQIVQVRSEFQKLEISFGVLLKSQEHAKDLMRELTAFAATTPYGLADTASAAKQLLAYGSAAGNITSELRMLGDVAAGTGTQLSDLVYLYGTLRTQGRAYAVDIRQFAGRGIPIYEELAKVLKVNTSEINAFVEAGKVGFGEVEQAFRNMTQDGGTFSGMTEALAGSLAGRLEQLTDAVDRMFNEMGQSSEGFIYDAIDGAAKLVENYKQVGRILGLVAVAFGTYKAALMATAAYEKAIAAIKGVQAAARANLVTLTQAQAAMELLKSKASSLYSVLAAHPYALIAAAVMAAAAAAYSYMQTLSSTARVEQAYANIQQATTAEFGKQEAKIKQLLTVIEDENQANRNRTKAIEELKAILPEYNGHLDTEGRLINHNRLAIEEYTKSLRENIRIRQIQAEIDNNIDAIAKAKADKAGSHKLLGSEKLGTVARWVKGVYSLGITEGAQALSDAYYDNIVKGREEANKTLMEDFEKSTKAAAEKSRKSDTFRKSIEAANKTVLKVAGLDRTKETIQEQLKAAQTAFESIPIVKKGSKEWIEAAEEVNRLKTELDAYSLSAKKAAAAGGGGGGRSTAANVANALKQQQEAQGRTRKLLSDAELEAREAEIKQEADGYRKETALIELEYDKRRAAIAEKEKEIRELRQKGGEQYSAEDAALIERLHAANEEARKASQERIDRELIAGYQDHAARKLAIEQKFQKDVAALQGIEAKARQDGDLQRAAEAKAAMAEAYRRQANEVDEIANELMTQTPAWKKFFGDIEKYSRKSLDAVIARLKLVIAYGKGEVGLGALPKEMQEAYKHLNDGSEESAKKLSELENQLSVILKLSGDLRKQNPFKAITDGIKSFKEAGKDSEAQLAALSEIFRGFDGVAGILGEIGSAFEKMGVKAGKALSVASATISGALGGASAGAQVGGGWGAVIGGVLGALGSLIPALSKSGDASQETAKYYDVLLKTTDELIDKQIELMKTADAAGVKMSKHATEQLLRYKEQQTRESLQKGLNGSGTFKHSERHKTTQWLKGELLQRSNYAEILQRAKDTLDPSEITRLVDSLGLGSRLDKALKKVELTRKKASKQQMIAYAAKIIEEYAHLQHQHQIGGAFDSGALSLQSGEGFNVEELKKVGIDPAKVMKNVSGEVQAMNARQIAALKQFWSSLWATFDDATRERLEAIEKIDEVKERLRETEREALTGVTFDSLTSELDRLVQVAELDFEKIADSFEQTMGRAVYNQIKKNYVDVELKKWYEAFAKANEDGVIDENEAKALETQYSHIAETAHQMYEKSAKLAGKTLDDLHGQRDAAGKENTLKGAFARASQESIDLLAGFMGAIRVTVESMLRLMMARTDSAGLASTADRIGELCAIQVAGWREVAAIRELTLRITDYTGLLVDVSRQTLAASERIAARSETIAGNVTSMATAGVKIKGLSGVGL